MALISELDMASAAAQPTASYLSVEHLLGGKQVLPVKPQTPLDWVSVIRNGIHSSAVDSLTKFTHLSQAELSAALGIPERTLARRKREGKLNSEESAKLIRLARVIGRAEAVFENFDVAMDWLKSANASLSRTTPLIPKLAPRVSWTVWDG